MEQPKPYKTKFITFYSFKGGVGRSAALINSAIFLARQGCKVVAIDFDFEAPGLNSYCRKINSECPISQDGIVEYFYDAIFSANVPTLKDRAITLTDFINSRNGGDLKLLSAGNIRSKKYAQALDSLKWAEIFEKYNGELVLENFKKQIVSEFEEPDYIFIDSRTGINESSGVCTRYLADVIVMLSSLNHQNILGTASIFKDLRADKKKFIFVASNVPVGMPTGEDQLLLKRIKAFGEEFGRDPDQFIYYYPALSLEESLPVLVHKEEDKVNKTLRRSDPLFDSYRSLAMKIDSSNSRSFLSLLKTACERNYIIFASNPTDSYQNIDAINYLLRDYPDRLLTKIFKRMLDWVKDSYNNTPDTWDHQEYQSIINALKKPAGTSLDRTEVFFIYETLAKVQKFISESTGMKKEFEIYFGEEDEDGSEEELTNVVFDELRLGRYEWVADFLARRLIVIKKSQESKAEDIQRSIIDTFNLARSLDFLGDIKEATIHYRSLLPVMDKVLDIEESAASEHILNRLVCAAIIYSKLSMPTESKIYLQAFFEKIENYKKDKKELFSPISYKLLDREAFKSEVKKEFNVL